MNTRTISNSWIKCVLITAVILIVWFWTQSLIGHRSLSDSGIGDGMHNLFAPWNRSLHEHPQAANFLLIVSSAVIDLMGLFLLGRWIFSGSVRPFLGLIVLMGLRQVSQALCALPAPPGIIWHYPGFPSLLVTYGVANDFFFSGHTAIAVFAGLELAQLKKYWLTALVVLLVIFEVIVVLVLRAHYTMDVITGIFAACCVSFMMAHFNKSPART
ncbi:MAG TPA: phosphatase PAP2-related protein [Terriglobales bacterium]|nr:phosphatase PAP2-related protein [Terriglobales bacterium]